jgi:hypothetical protein
MTARPVPLRHWRSYGDDPLPTPTEALNEPFSAFLSWFMRITCDRCGKDRMLSVTHATAAQRDMRRCADQRPAAAGGAGIIGLHHGGEHDAIAGCNGVARRLSGC